MSTLDDLGLDRQLYKAPLDGVTWDADTIADNLVDTSLADVAVTTGGAAADINNGSVTVDGSQLTPGSAIPQSAFNIANLGWVQTPTFTAASLNTVNWTSGTFTAADGTSYSIGSGTTGSMSAITYIYLDTSVSTTQYQTTTNQANVIGPNRVLIAVAQNQTGTATFNTVQTALITANNILVNSLSAISANLGTITAGSININNLSFINSNGYATFIGVSTLNMKTYTCFETSTRFSLSVGGTGTNSFSTNGLTQETGATATSFASITWRVSQEIFSGSPSFSASLYMDSLNVASGIGDGFWGLGTPALNGAGIIFSGNSFCGFWIQKTGGVVTLYAVQNNGSGGYSSVALTTVTTGDTLDLILKVNTGVSVSYYFRKNAGITSAVTTISTLVPTALIGVMTFALGNHGTAVDFQTSVLSASYER